MALLGQVFNAQNAATFSNTIPEGDYLAEVIKSELKENKKGTGSYLNWTFRVIDGDHAGFIFYDLMNILHNNPRAQAMGQRKLVELQEACGFSHGIEDTVELHGIPVCVSIVIRPEADGFPEKSEPKAFKPESEYVPE